MPADRDLAAALAQLGFQPRALTPSELKAYPARRVAAGFRITLVCEDALERRLDVLLRENDPLAIPVITLVDRPPPLVWPHVEQDGMLCLSSENDAFSLDNYAGVVTKLLGDAAQLINDCLAGRRIDDFRSEPISYWSQAESANAPQVIGLIEPPDRSTEVVIAPFVRRWIFGTSKDQVVHWLRNQAGDPEKKVNLHRGLLIRLERAPTPAEFPSTANDVHSLVASHAPELLETLERIASADVTMPVYLVLVAPTANGPFVAALSVAGPSPVSRGPGRTSDALAQGFRSKRVPLGDFVRRFFGQHEAVKSSVERADPPWVHGRGHNASIAKLSACTVAVLGCGSLGSGIASLLAQSGVGKLILVDCDVIKSANAARHILGLGELKEAKSLALKRSLQRKLPHLHVDAYYKSFESLSDDLVSRVGQSSLVISAMGATRSELSLNATLRTKQMPTTCLYTWMEPHAHACHAVALGPTGACFRCGFSARGQLLFQATQWPGQGTLIREPACGAFFQPYGAVALQHAVTLTAELALDILLYGQQSTHRVRVGTRRALEPLGGAWTSEWLSAARTDRGDIIVNRDWPLAPTCPERHG